MLVVPKVQSTASTGRTSWLRPKPSDDRQNKSCSRPALEMTRRSSVGYEAVIPRVWVYA